VKFIVIVNNKQMFNVFGIYCQYNMFRPAGSTEESHVGRNMSL